MARIGWVGEDVAHVTRQETEDDAFEGVFVDHDGRGNVTRELALHDAFDLVEASCTGACCRCEHGTSYFAGGCEECEAEADVEAHDRRDRAYRRAHSWCSFGGAGL